MSKRFIPFSTLQAIHALAPRETLDLTASDLRAKPVELEALIRAACGDGFVVTQAEHSVRISRQ